MATAINTRKWKKAIAPWSRCLCDTYGVNPVFIHSDKDMAEIGATQEVWEAKINLCWWHLRRAIRTRLAKAKLATSQYNIEQAMAEFTFIKHAFVPPGTRVDIDDNEGGILNDELLPLVDDEAPTGQSATPPTAAPLHPAPMATVQPSAPASSNGPSQYQPLPQLADATNFL